MARQAAATNPPEDKEARKMRVNVESVFKEATEALNFASFTGSVLDVSEKDIVAAIKKLCGREDKLVKLNLLETLATVNTSLVSLRNLQAVVKAAKCFELAAPNFNSSEAL